MLIGGMFIGRIADYFLGPHAYYVYVVGDKSDPSTARMLAAAAADISQTLDGTPVKFEVRNDLADPEKAESFAEQVVREPGTLMVVGHGSSSASQRALPVYMRASPAVPVLLTTDTNPSLLPPPAPTDDTVLPVFRLFPTDDNQAAVAAQFLGKHAKSVWLIEDTSNPTYSHYLVRKLLTDLYEGSPNVKVVLASNNLNLPPYAVDRLGIDWVFFAGDWRNALILIRQLQAMPGTQKPSVLLSDAAVDKSLKQFGQTDIEGVFLLHPLSADAFEQGEYVAVGQEAHALVASILDRVHEDFEGLAAGAAPVGYRVRQWLGVRRVGDARRAIARFMAAAVNNNLALTSSDHSLIMGKDRNTHAVIRQDASFHVWQERNGKFVSVQ
jgi:branched-chain amino acid transport system substrate-binding protein